MPANQSLANFLTGTPEGFGQNECRFWSSFDSQINLFSNPTHTGLAKLEIEINHRWGLYFEEMSTLVRQRIPTQNARERLLGQYLFRVSCLPVLEMQFLTLILRLIQETRSEGAGLYGRSVDWAPTKTRVCRCFTQATWECQVFNVTTSRHDTNSRSLRAENLPSLMVAWEFDSPPTGVWKVVCQNHKCTRITISSFG